MDTSARANQIQTEIQNLEKLSKVLDVSPDQFEEWLKQCTEVSKEFLQSLGTAPAWSQQKSSSEYKDEPTLFQFRATPFSSALTEFVAGLCNGGIDTAGGRYFGYIPGGGLPSAAVADLFAALTNRYAGLYLASPTAVQTENSVLQAFLSLFDFPQTAWGAITSGGSLATLAAVLAARETRPRKDWDRSTFYVSQLVHTAAVRAIKTAGLDPKLIRTIPVDSHQKMKTDVLQASFLADQKAGYLPWIVVGSLGTAGAGSVDPVQALLALRKQYGFWLHLDAAYGGFFALTDYGKKLFQGASEADSIVLDPHKSLFMPYGIGAVLVRDGNLLKQAFCVQDRILADLDDPLHRSPADYSPELTRHMRAARIELSLKIFGVAPFRAALDEKLLLARYVFDELEQESALELVGKPELSVVAFRVRGAGDQHTEALLKKILHRGRVHMSSIQLNGQFHIRICVLSFRSHLAEVQLAIEEIRICLEQ